MKLLLATLAAACASLLTTGCAELAVAQRDEATRPVAEITVTKEMSGAPACRLTLEITNLTALSWTDYSIELLFRDAAGTRAGQIAALFPRDLELNRSVSFDREMAVPCARLQNLTLVAMGFVDNRSLRAYRFTTPQQIRLTLQ